MLEVQVKRLTVRDLLALEAAQDNLREGKVSALVSVLESLATVSRDGQPVSFADLYVDELQQVVEQIVAAVTPKNSGSG